MGAPLKPLELEETGLALQGARSGLAPPPPVPQCGAASPGWAVPPAGAPFQTSSHRTILRTSLYWERLYPVLFASAADLRLPPLLRAKSPIKPGR